MKPWAARLTTYGIAGGLAALAIAFMRPLPERKPLADVAGIASTWEERVDSIGNGETLARCSSVVASQAHTCSRP